MKIRDMKYGYLWVTGAFFAISIVGHWFFGWLAYVQEALEHGSEIQLSAYLVQMLETTFENWQSEFLQLMWQVAGLAYLLYVGSPQSREGDERKEALIEHIVRKVDPENGETIIKKLAAQYPKQ
jgi:hypothetical protein